MSKNKLLVEEVELFNVNPMFTRVPCSSSCKVSVNLHDLAPCPGDVNLPSTLGQQSPPEPLNVNGKMWTMTVLRK